MTSKIVGGSEVFGERYPYTVQTTDLICTGFLIAPNVVLTSAFNNCYDGIESVIVNCPSTVDTAGCERIAVVDKALSEKVGLALFFLERNSVETPVDLLDLDINMLEEQVLPTVVSFGADERSFDSYDDLSSENLLETKISVIDGKTCLTQYSNPLNLAKASSRLQLQNAEDFFCGEPVEEGIAICQSDKGAGAILRCEGSEQDVLIGIYKQTLGCGNSGLSPVFTSLTSFNSMAFIRTELEQRGVFLDFKRKDFCSVPLLKNDKAPTPYPTMPNYWTCNAFLFANGGDCDCNCGQYDPDCEFSDVIRGCLPGQACSRDGKCVFDNSLDSTVPLDWICDPKKYSDGKYCDCNCGAIDPDCKDEYEDLVRGCLPKQTCQAGRCNGVGVAVPEEWQCAYNFYGSSDGCDCNCGANDPDCFKPGMQVFGCPDDKPLCIDDRCLSSLRTVEEIDRRGERDFGRGTNNSDPYEGWLIALGFAVCVTTLLSVYRLTRKIATLPTEVTAQSAAVDHTL